MVRRPKVPTGQLVANTLLFSSNQSAPKIIAQILIIGGRIVGKALYEAGRQAVKSQFSSSFDSAEYIRTGLCLCHSLHFAPTSQMLSIDRIWDQ
jgi:hypothetical protein